MLRILRLFSGLLLPFFVMILTFFVASESFSTVYGPKKELAESRLALVMGNAGYLDSPLKNPLNDAKDMTEALRKAGFTVILVENGGQREMEGAIRKFASRLNDDAVGLFYYAGHAVQIQGTNYLIPIDSGIEAETDVKYKAVNVNMILDAMGYAGNQINIVILDSCRDNPLTRSFRSLGKSGLAEMEGYSGTMIVYATSPGKVALDGTGDNGVFTEHLLKRMMTPGMMIEQVVKSTRIDVAKATGNEQIPWSHSSLMRDFSFIEPEPLAAIPEKPKKPDPPKKEKPPSLIPKNPTGAVSINTRPPGAEVFVNGESRGVTPLEIENLPVGEVDIHTKLEGFTPQYWTYNVEPSKREEFEFILSPVKNEKSRLFINASPSQSTIRILNISPPYVPGIRLDAGEYHVEVSQDGYETYRAWVSLKKGETKKVPVQLQAIPEPVYGSLTVQTSPADAQVRILNIKEKYAPGIQLQPGRFLVEVARNGYRTEKQWVPVGDGEAKRVEISLQHEGPRATYRDDRFIVYENGILWDTRTNLMWSTSDNGKNINWDQARGFCERFQGGGYTDWRLPTATELQGLYNRSTRNPSRKTQGCQGDLFLPHIFQTTCYAFWASETHGENAACFYFDEGVSRWDPKHIGQDVRVRPVRRVN